jgi:PilZ domain
MEQRKYPRFPINWTVTFTIDAAKVEGRVLNLSLGGGAIESEVAISEASI